MISGIQLIGLALVVTLASVVGIFLLVRAVSKRCPHRQPAVERTDMQRQRRISLSRDVRLSETYNRLIYRVLIYIVAQGYALYGIPLASTVFRRRFLAGAPPIRGESSGRMRRELPTFLMEDGSRRSVQEVLDHALANGEPPSAQSGPSVLDLLMEMNYPPQDIRPTRNESVNPLVENLMVELQEIEERHNQSLDSATLQSSHSDADKIYGSGVPYTVNLANVHVVCIPADDRK